MDKPKSPPPPHATTPAASSSRSLQNLKSLLLKCAIASTPAKKSLTAHQKAFIGEQIEQIFPNIHTPDHPTYAWMIENAIRQLKEDCGSSEESISKFICEEYKDLPFAHASLLRHHLKKLSESDDLVLSPNGCYSIAKSTDLHNPNLNFTNTTSLIPLFSSTNSTYSSSECHVPNRKAKGKKINRKRSQNARGIQIRTKHGHGRGRGRGLGSNENTMMEVFVDHQCITINDDAVDENVQGNRNQDFIVEPLWQGDIVGGVDNGSTRHRKKVISSGQGSTNLGPCQGSVRSIRTPLRGKRRGRPCKRDVQMVEYGNNMEMANVEKNQNQDSVDVENTIDEERIEPLWQGKLVGGVDNGSTSSQQPRNKVIISGQGSKDVGRSVRSIRTPQRGKRRGRPRKRDVQMEEYGKNMEMANVEENRNQDHVDVENRVCEERIEPLWQGKLVVGVDNGSTPSTRHRKQDIISGQGSKNVDTCQRSVRSICTPQRGKRRGRPRKRDMQMVEYGNNMEMANVEERDDEMEMLDELIEEVYLELKGETERECLEIQDSHAEVMERELNLRKDDEICEPFGLEPLEREHCVDDNLEEDVGSRNHVVNENQFQPQPEQTELALVLYEPQRQESYEIEQQVQPEGMEMKITEPTATTTET